MTRLVLIGPPGSGKSTQGQDLALHYNVPFISAGDLLREEVTKGSTIGHLAISHMARGEMVPDELTITLIGTRISEPDCDMGFVLDGFPRNLLQTTALNEILSILHQRLTMAIHFKIGDEVIVERLSGRRICSDCGAIYHIVFNPPMIGMTCYACHSTIELTNGMLKCQVCARPIAQRNDDRPQVIRKRLRVYWRQINPVLNYYRQHSLLREIDATGSPQEVFRKILGLFGKTAA